MKSNFNNEFFLITMECLNSCYEYARQDIPTCIRYWVSLDALVRCFVWYFYLGVHEVVFYLSILLFLTWFYQNIFMWSILLKSLEWRAFRNYSALWFKTTLIPEHNVLLNLWNHKNMSNIWQIYFIIYTIRGNLYSFIPE